MEHRTRLFIIAALTFSVLVAIVVLSALGVAPDLAARLEGALAVLLPAILDAGQEQRKQAKKAAKASAAAADADAGG